MKNLKKDKLKAGQSEVVVYRTARGFRWKCYGANYEVTSRGGEPFKPKNTDASVKRKMRDVVKKARRQIVLARIRFDF